MKANLAYVHAILQFNDITCLIDTPATNDETAQDETVQEIYRKPNSLSLHADQPK